MRTTLCLFIATAGAACAARPPAPLALPRVVPPVASSAAPTAPTSTPRIDLARLLCADRQPCDVRRDRVAGADLHVVSIDLGVRSFIDDAPPVAAAYPGSDVEETATGDTLAPIAVHTKCRQLEYWLVTDRGARNDPSTQLLASACNDGHGASGVGEDAVEIADGRFVFDSSGGSSWRWSGHSEVALAPIHLAKTSWTNSWALGPNVSEGSFDWEHLAGTASWFSPECDANGDLPAGEPPDEPPYEYRILPSVALDDAYRGSDWQSTSLAACSLDLDGTGQRGFVLHGGKGKREEASMRAVLSQKGELFVEVRDATPTPASKRWVVDDHIEIWIAADAPSYMDHCLARGRPAPKQWGVRVSDGQVFSGAGAPPVGDLTVTRAVASDGTPRFKILLPPIARAITIAYSDGDRGKQKRLFASSRVKRGASETLGASFSVDERRVVCRADRGTLVAVLKDRRDPDDPFVDGG